MGGLDPLPGGQPAFCEPQSASCRPSARCTSQIAGTPAARPRCSSLVSFALTPDALREAHAATVGGSHMPVESDEDDEAEAVQAALRVERKAVANAAAAARQVELNARREAAGLSSPRPRPSVLAEELPHENVHFWPKSFKFVLRGSAPRPRLVMQTHQAETRNPKPSGRMDETRNPGRRGKAKPETQTRAKPRQGARAHGQVQ